LLGDGTPTQSLGSRSGDLIIVAEMPRNVAVFALALPQSVELLTALVHDPDLPYRVRQGAALILLPHLRAERDRLLRERAMARTGMLRVREHEREVIGWT
jgi:hypothetical protein